MLSGYDKKGTINRGGENMPCIVGITTRPKERKQEWENEVVGLENWEILSKHRKRGIAQDKEDQYAEKYDCKAMHGGRDGSGLYYVYKFEYTRTRSN